MTVKTYTPERTHKWYCGPFAFSVLTGCNFKSTRTRLNDAANRPLNAGIRGYPSRYLLAAINLGPFNLRTRNESPCPPRPPFKDWVKYHRAYPDGTYLLELTDHYVIVKGGLFIDNHTKHWVGIDYAPWKRKLVRNAYRITTTGD